MPCPWNVPGSFGETGFISRAQHIFGLHYDAGEMPRENADLLAEVERYGFGWFSDGEAGQGGL